MTLYRVKKKAHFHKGKLLSVGSLFYPTGAELSTFPDRFEKVEDAPEHEPEPDDTVMVGEIDTSPNEPPEVELDISLYPVKKVMSLIANRDITLDEALAQEREGRKRKTLIAELEDLKQMGKYD